MNEGDIVECIKTIYSNEEFNVGDRAIVIYNSFYLFKIKKLGSDKYTLLWPDERDKYFSLPNYDRKSRIDKLSL